MQNIVNLLFEAGMLKRTPRTGLQFLGTGSESVAEHAFRVTFIGYVLSRIEKDIDETKLIKMCLLHDLHEARTGDLTYMNKKYVKVDEKRATNRRPRLASHRARRTPAGEASPYGPGLSSRQSVPGVRRGRAPGPV